MSYSAEVLLSEKRVVVHDACTGWSFIFLPFSWIIFLKTSNWIQLLVVRGLKIYDFISFPFMDSSGHKQGNSRLALYQRKIPTYFYSKTKPSPYICPDLRIIGNWAKPHTIPVFSHHWELDPVDGFQKYLSGRILFKKIGVKYKRPPPCTWI